jgi:hypothetical protein
MAAAPKHPRVTAKQLKADQASAAKGRAVQKATRAAAIAKTGKPPPRSKKQAAASKAWAAAGRAAQAATRAGKTPVKPKAATAGIPQANLSVTGELPGKTAIPLHFLPACVPVALAAHLHAFTGLWLPDEDVAAWYKLVQRGPIGDLLEYAAVEGFSGHRLKIFQRCDPERALPGMLCGLQTPAGYHAVLAHPAGVLTWGMVMPWPGAPAEAWHLEWEDLR